MELALALGKEVSADIVMGTDPDADRLGIAVPGPDGFTLVTGNQLGVLLADYILGGRKELGTLPANPVFVTTIVTTPLQKKVAESYGVKVEETLTGFKHIATVMRRLEKEPHLGTYVMGDEESYGYLIGTEVRDKDAITATVLTAEMAVYLVSQGKSVLQRLNEIYEQFGYHEEIQISRYFEGQSGGEIMDSLMRILRNEPPDAIGGVKVREIRDYKEQTIKRPGAGVVSRITLPESNVLQFVLEDKTVVSARPSGTEPKIKFYASVSEAPGPLDQAKKSVAEQLQKIRSWVEATIAAVSDGGAS